MPDEIKFHVENAGDNNRRTVVFPNGDSENLLVVAIDTEVFRLEESATFEDLRYHDIIRATVRDNGVLAMKEIVSRSGLSTLSWVVSPEMIDSVEFGEFLSYVISIGGYWERLFRGWLLVHVPPELTDTASARFGALLDSRRS